MRYGYARVSTAKQDYAIQVDALKAAGCETIFTECSGSRCRRYAVYSRQSVTVTPQQPSGLSHRRDTRGVLLPRLRPVANGGLFYGLRAPLPSVEGLSSDSRYACALARPTKRRRMAAACCILAKVARDAEWRTTLGLIDRRNQSGVNPRLARPLICHGRNACPNL
jgi:hypothetical protein